MENPEKRARGSNWSHGQTMALAELKREASLNKEDGRLVWERTAQTLSSRFPDQIRTLDQCRRRWDTLVKVYNRIENYCVQTGAQDHRELDGGELASIKLDTAYQQDWYDIVEQVCSQRKWKERCDSDLMLPKRIKGSGHSVELPEHPPNRDTLCSASTSNSVTHREQSDPESTTTFAQVSSSPSSEADKLSPEEEVPRLKNGHDGLMLQQSPSAYAQVPFSPSLEVDKLSPEEEVRRLKNGNDGLVLGAPQLRHGQVSQEVSQEPQTLESAHLLPHTFPAENVAQLKEPLQDDLWALLDDPPFEISAEIEQSGTESELTDPALWGWESVLHIDVVAKEDKHCSYNSFEPANEAKATKALRASNRRDPRRRQEYRLHCVEGKQLVKIEVLPSAGSALRSDHDITNFLSKLRLDDLKTEPTMVSSGKVFQSVVEAEKVIVLNVLQCCHACGRKERAEDMEMDSKQARRLEEKARKKALMPRKENVPPMLDASSSTSATSATRGDKPLQKDTERISKPAASDKKEEETRSLKAERQQLGGKSSSKCVPIAANRVQS